jgi:formate C-acetyltransferase
VDEGGAIYNFIMPNFLGMSNVVDELAAIQKLVFESHELTLNEFNDILIKNYNNNEAFRNKIINKLPHFGNNEPLTDGLAQRVSLLLMKRAKGLTPGVVLF